MSQKKKVNVTQEGIEEFNRIAHGTHYQYNMVDITPKRFSAFVRLAFNSFSPTILGVTGEDYANIMEVTDGRYTLAQMNILLQVLPQASGKGMAMAVDEYITFIRVVKRVSVHFAEVWDAIVKDIEGKYPLIEQEEENEILPAETPLIRTEEMAQA